LSKKVSHDLGAESRPNAESVDGATGVASSQSVLHVLNTPGAELVYAGTGRRLSAQQIAAAYRRMAEAEKRTETQAEVDRLEAELADVLVSWRRLMPTMPTPAEYEMGLLPRAFEFGEATPQAPDLETERKRLLLELESEAQKACSPGRAATAIPVASGLLVGAAAWIGAFGASRLPIPILGSIGAGGVAAILAIPVAEVGRSRRVSAWTEARREARWDTRVSELEQQFTANKEAHEVARKVAESHWSEQEARRVEHAKRLMGGDCEAIDQEVTATLLDMDFPFDTGCSVAVADARAAFVNLDLPEIEDVIPEFRHKVLKSGEIRSVKRPAAERSESYARLVAGIVIAIAAAAVASAPTLASVTVAAFTQRRNSKSGESRDVYVIEAAFRREFLESSGLIEGDPVDQLVSLPGARVLLGSSGLLKPISPPDWIGQLAE